MQCLETTAQTRRVTGPFWVEQAGALGRWPALSIPRSGRIHGGAKGEFLRNAQPANSYASLHFSA
jgi:hypothetical protein